MWIFDSSFGIDFKRNYLILTLLQKSFGKMKLADYRIHPILPEDQREERESQVIHLISQFISTHSVNKEKISISIPREKVIARFIRLPIVTKENLRKVLDYEAAKYTPFGNKEIYFDYHLMKEEKEWLHLFAVFIKKAEVDDYLSLLKKVGIQPISVQIPSTAALNLFFYHKTFEKNGMAVLVDVTEPFFEMNLIHEGDWKRASICRYPRKRGSKDHPYLQTIGVERGYLFKVNLLRLWVGRCRKDAAFSWGKQSDQRCLFSPIESD